MAAGARHKSSMSVGTLYYKRNKLGDFRFRTVALGDQSCVGTDSCLAVV